MKKELLLLLSLLTFSAVRGQEFSPVDHVNTLVGTMSKHSFSNGNTYPAVAMPWGMNFWTPQTGPMGDGWIYTYTADKIRGFRQTHQPSPWMNDYGQFSLMPVTGSPAFDQDGRASWYSHKAEDARPYYYSVYLADHDVLAEITPTERAAMFRFTFPENENSFVVADAFDRGSHVRIIPSGNKIVGYTTRNSGGVPDNFRNYFVMVFDKPFAFTAVCDGASLREPASAELGDRAALCGDELAYTGDHALAVVGFRTRKGEKVHVRVASSFISPEQAEQNLAELGERSFDEVVAAGKKRWNEVLGRIRVEQGNIDDVRTFYSCLYRSVLFPRIFHEVTADGRTVHYSPYNGEVCDGYMFTDTGFWDTFRSLFPLLNLVYPEMNAMMQEGLVNAYRESGFLPEWASPGHRGSMVGNNSASVIADAYLSGLRGHDAELLWEAVTRGAHSVHPEVSSTGRLGWQYYDRLGYVPCDVGINESAARTLEYAYDDWCIYRFGCALGKPFEQTEPYLHRAMNYRKLLDPGSSLMRGRNEDGSFQSPFNPLKWGDVFTEGNSWHYTWSVFHDPAGLIGLMGGEQNFNAMLDSVFTVPPLFDAGYYGFVIHEIREMQVANMGNYAHGNQPAQHMIYLYNYSGQPWKAQYWTREVMNRLYSATPDGYCGDEDNGQTSAWYVFSALGFYPVCPGSGEYVLGSPLFGKVTVDVGRGKRVTITAKNNSPANRYIRRMKVNGRPYGANFLTREVLTRGARIEFFMAPEPDFGRGTAASDRPYSLSESPDRAKIL